MININQAKEIPKYPKYKAAGINFDPKIYQKDDNIKALLALVEEAAQNGAKLIATPEMATTGYCFYSREDIKSYVETIPGPTTEAFEKLAKQYSVYIVVGMPEVDPETDYYYNTAVLVGPDGVVGKHRKTHPYIAEPKWARQGDLGHQVFTTPLGNIAMLVCKDIHYFETCRIGALKGADVLVHISCWLAEKAPAHHWQSRAFENGYYIVEGERYGLERGVNFSGGSCIIDPDGSVQSFIDKGEGIAYGEIDILRSRGKKFPNGGNKLLDRKPEEYMDLVLNPYIWNPFNFFRLYQHDVLPKGKKSRVSVVQTRPKQGDIIANLQTIKEKAAQAALEQSELVVFPELMLTGFVSPNEAASLAMPVDGFHMAKLLDICLRHRIFLVVGMIEKDDDKLYNTAVLLGPEGITGKQRKIHLCDLDEGWASPGCSGIGHFNTPVGRVGIMIGHDSMFPEYGRLLGNIAVDLICCPAAVNFPKPLALAATENHHIYPVPMAYDPIHWHLWRGRGGENNCYMAFANQIGPYTGSSADCIGRSGIFGPDMVEFPRREIVASADEEDLLTMEIDTSCQDESVWPSNIVRRKDYFIKRQPLHYDMITRKNPPVCSILKDY